VLREAHALDLPDRVAPHRQRALGGELGVELADRPGRALRGFMNVDCPASARRSLSAVKSGSDM
jgi:hypothetical protein